MNVSILVLILTFIGAFALVLTAVLLYLSYWKPPEVPVEPEGSLCVKTGVLPSVSVPNFTRNVDVITPVIPVISTNQLDSISNTTPPNVRTRGLYSPLPTNKWYSPILVGLDSGWLAQYPYFLSVNSSGVAISWSTTSSDQQGLQRTWNNLHPLVLTPGLEKIQGLDVLDWDAEGLVLEYSLFSPESGQNGGLRYPVIRGCPYLSVLANNSALTLTVNENGTLSGPELITDSSSNIWYKWTLTFSDKTYYAIYISRMITPTMVEHQVLIDSFSGWCRVAYVGSTEDSLLLDQNVGVIPVATTLSSTAIGYTLTYSSPDSQINSLMTVLSPTGRGGGGLPGLLPYNYQIGPISVNLDLSVPDFVVLTNPNLVSVFQKESPIVQGMQPTEFGDWCRWIGSIALLIQIGQVIGVDTSDLLELLSRKLTKPPGTLYADSAWNLTTQTANLGVGVIPNLNLDSCTATAGVYTGTLHDYGYLMFAWDTLLKMQPVGTLPTPGPGDLLNHVMASLTREKDWWTGWDQTGGLSSSGQVTWPESSLFAYWSAYRLGQTLGVDSDLSAWTLRAMGATRLFLNTWCYQATWNPLQSANYFSNTGYGLQRTGGDQTYPNRYAALLTTLTKPMTPILAPVQDWFNRASQFVPLDNTLTPESLLTSLYIHRSSITVDDVVPLPYGSLWTAGAYLLNM